MAKKNVNWPKILKALEIESLAQALLVSPADCLDLRKPHSRWSSLALDQDLFLDGHIDSVEFQDGEGHPTRSPYPSRAKILLHDADGVPFSMTVFGAKPWKTIAAGSGVRFVGRITEFHGKRHVQFGSFVRESGFVLPQYQGVQGMVAGTDLRRLVRKALQDTAAFDGCVNAIHEIPGACDVLIELGYVDAGVLLRHLHQPQTPEQCREAVRAAKALSLRVLQSNARRDFGAVAPAHQMLDAMRKAVAEWPQPPSDAQRRALGRLARILSGDRASRTLLLGDVGSGKTRVFATPVAAFARAGRRCAILAPNAPVAQQIMEQLHNLWPDLSVGLCTASLRESDARVLVGTTALVSEIEALPERLALLVVDEQHKFSVDQRDLPVDHVIEASATPIPRSLALAEAGGWHLATIDRSAIQRSLHSHLMGESARTNLQRMALNHIRAGRRVVYVYPVVQADTDQSVIRAHERLDAHFAPIGGALLLHGKMSEESKIAAVEAFKRGDSRVLVCTTAVEVGLDVPGIGLMVVIDAGRYGASQLHQLRGRLARDGGEGDFVMYLDGQPGAKTLARLRDVEACDDGLELARRDLNTRGVGALLGSQQSGRARTLFLRAKVSLDDLRAQ